MRILFAATKYIEKGESATGFPNYLRRVSLALLQFGHTPIIVAAGTKDNHRFEEGIEIWTVKTQIKFGKILRGENFAHLQISYLLNRKIREITKKTPVDIIQFTSIGGLALCYHGKTPAVMRLSSYAKTYFSSLQSYDARTLRGKAALERWSSYRCDAVFAPCRVTADAFGKDCKRHVKVIETPFVNDVKVKNDQFVNQNLRDKKYVLFFGTLYPEKGILVITEILKAFLQQNPDYYFVFVGEVRKIQGKDARAVIRKAAGEFSDRVIVSRPMQHEMLYPVIEHADFVVLPSLMDNFPNACIEAMYFSKIVIGTDGASFEQIIKDGYNGFLCKIGDSEDLLRKMQHTVELKLCIRQKMEHNAHKSTQRLQPEYTVRKLLKLYEYVIQERRTV